MPVDPQIAASWVEFLPGARAVMIYAGEFLKAVFAD